MLSQRPLYVLLFLLPLVAFFEFGSIKYLADPESGVVETIRARSILSSFFRAFDVAGLFLPGAALVTVLLIWHVLNKDPWRIRPAVLAGMAVESVMWTMPLLIIAMVLGAMAAPGGAPVAAQALQVHDLRELPWQAALTVSIGAGLYEELLFRMIGIAALHLVLVDLAKVSEFAGRAIAVLLSAVAFALYHDLSVGGGGISWGVLAFYIVAGSYFGCVYVTRGFGIVVAVHALYDVLVLVVLPRLGS